MSIERAMDIEADVRLMSMRLQSTQSNLYDDFDRFKSEAEFRRAIALPLSALVASIVLRSLELTFIGVLATLVMSGLLLVVMHVLSWRKSREGNDLIIQSLEIGQVESPTIEALEKAAAKAEFGNEEFEKSQRDSAAANQWATRMKFE